MFLSRYMDNNYVCLFNVPEEMLGAVCELMQCFSRMKWEPEGPCITWCEGSLSMNHCGSPTPSLCFCCPSWYHR